MAKDNSTGKNKEFYELGKKMFDRLNPLGAPKVKPSFDVIKVMDILQKRYMGDNNREDLEVLRCIADVKKHFGVTE